MIFTLTSATESHIATKGQTAFTLLNPTALIVALDGAFLAEGTDYALAGATLTLATPASAGQRLFVVSLNAAVS